MPKRKRSFTEPAPSGKSTGSASQQRLAFKIETAARSLTSAFKLAKGFERQKLGRRLKTAASQPGDSSLAVEKVQREVSALKALEPARAADVSLARRLVAVKGVEQHEDLPGPVRQRGKEPVVVALGLAEKTDLDQTALLNVHARMCNSNPVKEAVPSILDGMLKLMGVQSARNGDKDAGKKKRMRSKDFALADTEGQTKRSASPDSFAGFDDDDDKMDELDDDALDYDSDDSDVYAAYSSRLAPSGSEDDEDHSSSPEYDSDASLSSSAALADLEARLLAEQEHSSTRTTKQSKARPAPKPSEQRTTAPITKSAFLPALTHAAYVPATNSDSDASLSDPDEEYDSDGLPRAQSKQKKKGNRRGQRARQAIWEAKYGGKAKHLVDPKGPSKGGDAKGAGWDAKRGAVGSGARGGRGGFGGRGGRGGAERGGRRSMSAVATPAAAVAERMPSRDDQGPIHPSWEAAKRAKEMASKIGATKYQGTKITF